MPGFLLVLLLAVSASPEPGDHVTDRAGMLKLEDVAVLEGRLAQFEHQTSERVLVYIDRDDSGAINGKNKSVILFVFCNAQTGRIQVGSRLRRSLSEEAANDIVRAVVTPRLQAGDCSAAVMDGTSAILKTLRIELSGAGRAQQHSAIYRMLSRKSPFYYLFAVTLALLLYPARRAIDRFLGIGWWNRRSRGRSW